MLGLNKSDDALNEEIRQTESETKSFLPSIGKLRLPLLGVGFVICAIVSVVIIRDIQVRRELEEASRARMENDGSTAPAILENEYKTIVWKNGKRTYEVSYSFSVDSRSYHGKCELARKPETNKAIAVFDPDNPSMNKLEGRAIPPMDTSDEPFWTKQDSVRVVVIMVIFAAIGAWRRLRTN